MNRTARVLISVWMVLAAGAFLYFRIIKPTAIKHCLEKYGKEMNPYRRKLGIPIIPDYWHIKDNEETFIAWDGKLERDGHNLKRIVHSGCDLESEVDNYILPPQNGVPRFIEMTYIYKKNTGKDSLQIIYQIDGTWKYITKKQMDSIFDADKIKRDY